ncbi:molybdopterin/thiamine biosynthesis adenylyltransferase [Luteibacter sp. Sphag1AF]|uniref:ThiF family adenylyltransferase n=1 Tax=Luteibacter sp. Sphag1AF TaxID=2587031 RepID=UPI00161096D0|nr:ThiF family adenylyltransferase [Luteibacter sp. Sphag1AF]MBB3228879.1 molybdopterin/thiamine biosynthesis adenylyltransferase [Luteibacter sp. Sphag1AF]
MGLTTSVPGPERLDEFVMRNVDVVSAQEQSALRGGRLLVAGCGSVGASLAEPLVRMGIGSLVLADPESFDLHNINRQACVLADVGRSKARVLDERLHAINPYLDTTVYDEGLTEANLEASLTGVSVIFDAIDAASSPWVKYRVHQLAAERRIPVISGFDFGGKAVLYVFDYRRKKTRPFYGRASEEAHREGRLSECLTWLGYTHFPADFLPVISDRMVTKQPWPQVSYCVLAMGALGTRCVLELLMCRRVPHIVAFDTHMKMRGRFARIAQVAKVPLRLVDALVAAKKGPSATPAVAQVSPVDAVLAAHPVLRSVIEAMVLAPSPHNCQPWHFTVLNDREIQIGWDRSRALPAVDPEGFAIAYGLGCAIEAAASVADIGFRHSEQEDILAPDYVAGVLTVHGLKADGYVRARGLLESRTSNRHRFIDVPVADEVGRRCDRLVAPFRSRAVVMKQSNATLYRMGHRGALDLFRSRAYMDELFDFMRLSRKEVDADPTGFTPDGLGLGRAETFAMALLRRLAPLRRALSPLGLARAMAKNATATIRSPSSFALIATSDFTARGRIDVGRAIMRTWLELTAEHLVCQPIDFPISTPQGRDAVAAMFGLTSGERPVVLLRVGRAKVLNASRSPRRSIASFCAIAPDFHAVATQAHNVADEVLA